jgi:transposase
MQFETIITCSVPRIDCKEHGIATQDSAKNLLRLSWDDVHGIQERAVEIGLKKRTYGNMKYIGIDEKSFLTGHKYITVLHNNETGKVIDIVEDRTEEAATELINKIPEDIRNSIEAVTMDMWPAYMNSVNSIILKILLKNKNNYLKN